MLLTGSEILIECLKEQGVDVVFGYPGGAILNVYDALYKHGSEIKHYLTSHEQGAAHAADGYARSTGKVGVCFATSGPGATNLVTGIATAQMDSIPLVAITCNVGLPLLGKDSFQEVDIAGVTMPITKHNYIVKDVNKLADTIRSAFRIAAGGRKGAVLVDITKDVTANKAEYTYKAPEPVLPHTASITESDVARAAELINSSEKPLLYVGGGAVASGARDEILSFLAKTDMPVCSTSMGLGVVPSDHPNYLGMIGMHGSVGANVAANECDLLISAGARFSDRVATSVKRFAPNAKIIHLDVDPAEVNKNIKTTASVIGDLKEIFKQLKLKTGSVKFTPWKDEIVHYHRENPIKYSNDGHLHPQFIIEKINEVTKGEAIIATEVGQHQMWACQFLKVNKPRRLLTSGGLGTMGYGLGAAIGAKAGNPDKTVINIAGDGCFYMNNNELATSVFGDLPVIEVLINNEVLGMVRQWQTLLYGRRYSHTTLDKGTDFGKLAEAYGALSFEVKTPEEFEPALRAAIESGKTCLINCIIDRDEMVLPMIPAGAACDDMITFDDMC
ncbi:MAG: biosynthetic-type acetolactate synthase large subunit [Clostridiales bacterium]|nr:biosynthetic-type acetolactate synthase large subunit [Clostridiales bacterium]